MRPFLAYLLLPLGKGNSLFEVIATEELRAFLLWIIVLVLIIGKHTIGGELRGYLSYGIFDKATPLYRDSFAILIIESRCDLVFYDIVDHLRIEFILVFLVLVGTFLRKHPTGILTIAFYPPAIEYAKVHYPIHSCLFPTGTGGFERTCRGIHPYIHPLDKGTR